MAWLYMQWSRLDRIQCIFPSTDISQSRCLHTWMQLFETKTFSVMRYFMVWYHQDQSCCSYKKNEQKLNSLYFIFQISFISSHGPYHRLPGFSKNWGLLGKLIIMLVIAELVGGIVITYIYLVLTIWRTLFFLN